MVTSPIQKLQTQTGKFDANDLLWEVAVLKNLVTPDLWMFTSQGVMIAGTPSSSWLDSATGKSAARPWHTRLPRNLRHQWCSTWHGIQFNIEDLEEEYHTVLYSYYYIPSFWSVKPPKQWQRYTKMILHCLSILTFMNLLSTPSTFEKLLHYIL